MDKIKVTVDLTTPHWHLKMDKSTFFRPFVVKCFFLLASHLSENLISTCLKLKIITFADFSSFSHF